MTLVAVSKTVPADRIRAAVAAGFRVLGENRVQEAAAKIPVVDGAAWHLIGPLQANKARRAVELFDVIESVHTLELAQRLATVAAEVRPGRAVPVLLQVNVDRDPAKAGFDPDTVEAALEGLDGLAALDFRGLMTIGRFAVTPTEARATFVGPARPGRAAAGPLAAPGTRAVHGHVGRLRDRGRGGGDHRPRGSGDLRRATGGAGAAG